MLLDRSLLGSAPSGDSVPFASKSEHLHDLVVVYNSGKKKWDIQQYYQEQFGAFSAATSIPAGNSGQIVFIRGYISPSWVCAIGSKYHIDPEFFRRHLDFLSTSVHTHSYGFPSLASSSNNIVRLCVSTILHRDNYVRQDLPLQRSDQSTGLGRYKVQQLGSNKAFCGDSLVREYSTVCSHFSIIEQWISLCIMKRGSGWTGRRLYYMP